MAKSQLFFPVAFVGLVGLVLDIARPLSILLIVVGLAGVVWFAARGASHDDELRREATGVGESERGPDDPGRRSV